MNKKELVEVIAKQTQLTQKDVAGVVAAFTETVATELKKGGKVQLVGFGTFSVAERAPRVGRNPRTTESIKIQASKSPKFKPGQALKAAVNKKK